MILVDIPKGPKDSPQYKNQAALRTYIRSMGVECDSVPLEYGDAVFEGNGPDGTMAIGIERKSLHDMLSCIEDSRYVSHQRIGMKKLYAVNVLIIEGYWRPKENGMLMESRDGCTWWPCKPHGRQVMYGTLRRYLISIRHSGVSVNFTQNLWHTAYDICEEYHYHQKAWDKHTSLMEIHKLAIPQMSGKASLTRQWAAACEGVGVKMSQEAEQLFRRPIKLATADEAAWLRIPGMGVKKAQQIVKEIHGQK